MSRTPIAPDGVPHFSADPSQPFDFYTGWPSNFDRKHALYLPSPVAPPQPAFAAVPLRYGSGEHWLHCNKGRTWEEHERIRRAATPYEAKQLGGARQLPLDHDEVRAWDARRYKVMVIGPAGQGGAEPRRATGAVGHRGAIDRRGQPDRRHLGDPRPRRRHDGDEPARKGVDASPRGVARDELAVPGLGRRPLNELS